MIREGVRREPRSNCRTTKFVAVLDGAGGLPGRAAWHVPDVASTPTRERPCPPHELHLQYFTLPNNYPRPLATAGSRF